MQCLAHCEHRSEALTQQFSRRGGAFNGQF